MAILPICIIVVVAAACFSMLCVKKSKRGVIVQQAKSALVTIVFLLYPGIVTRVFTTFKCRRIGEKSYLVADYSVVCGQGEHTAMIALMSICALVYVVGIPMGSALLLFYNRKSIRFDDGNQMLILPAMLEKRKAFQSVFGALYNAYDPEYWYFESIIMIQKALLTGGLVLVAVREMFDLSFNSSV